MAASTDAQRALMIATVVVALPTLSLLRVGALAALLTLGSLRLGVVAWAEPR